MSYKPYAPVYKEVKGNPYTGEGKEVAKPKKAVKKEVKEVKAEEK